MGSTDWIRKAIVLVDSICESRLSTRVVEMQRRGRMGYCTGLVINKEKGWVINRVNNEGDSLGAFRLRIAAFDAGCANATAGQAVNREKGW